MEESMRKQVIRRSMRYWGGWTEKYYILLLGLGILYALLMMSVSGEGWTANGFVDMGACAVAMEVVALFVIPLVASLYHLPLALSFGSGRKEALLGLQFTILFTGIQTLLLFGITEWLGCSTMGAFGAEFAKCAGSYFAAAAGAVLFLMALGQIGASLTLRYGMKGMMAYLAAFFVLLFVAAFVIGFSAGSGNMEESEIMVMLVSADFVEHIKSAAVLLLAVGAVLCMIGSRILKRGILRYEVQI